jgi:hypothetical protein
MEDEAHQAAWRSPSSLLGHSAIWFQLAKARLTTPPPDRRGLRRPSRAGRHRAARGLSNGPDVAGALAPETNVQRGGAQP